MALGFGECFGCVNGSLFDRLDGPVLAKTGPTALGIVGRTCAADGSGRPAQFAQPRAHDAARRCTACFASHGTGVSTASMAAAGASDCKRRGGLKATKRNT